MMDETQFAALETLYEAYADDERKYWEEMGRPDIHLYWAWQRIGDFIAEEKARRGEPDDSVGTQGPSA